MGFRYTLSTSDGELFDEGEWVRGWHEEWSWTEESRKDRRSFLIDLRERVEAGANVDRDRRVAPSDPGGLRPIGGAERYGPQTQSILASRLSRGSPRGHQLQRSKART